MGFELRFADKEITLRGGGVARHDSSVLMKLFGRLYRWFFGNLHIDNLTFDLDSAAMTRYGQQQGTTCDYDPALFCHSLVAFVVDTCMIVNINPVHLICL